ncbi:hypothetical protein [Thermococcus sp.]
MEELSEALKAVEEELNLAKKVYRASVFLYWAWAMLGIYLLAKILGKYAGISEESAFQWLSLVAVGGFIVEERKTFKKVLHLERVLGKVEKVSREYIIAQILVWPVSAVIASIYMKNEGLWMLVFIGSGLILLTGVEFLFTSSRDWRTLLAGLIILCSTTLYTGTAYPIMVISFSASLTAYLFLKGAMRE